MAAPHRLGRMAVIGVTAAAVLTGCSLTPTYERPPAPVAEQFPAFDAVAEASAAAPAQAQAQAMMPPPWQAFVGDARTRALVEQALRGNRDLRVAVLGVERARAALGVQGAERLPAIGAGAIVERSSAGSVYSAGLSLASYELDLFGRVRALTDAAAAELLGSDAARRAATLSLVAAVIDTELALRADDALIAATEQVLAGRRATLGLVQRRVDGGVAAAPELRANESLVAAARVSLAALQRQRLQRENALVLLLGGPLPADLPPPRPLAEHLLPELQAGLPSQVLLQRPDVAQAEQQLVAANARIGAARAAFFPRISLTGSVGTASAELGGLFERGAWSFTGQLLQPLFNAGRNRAGLAAAEVGRDIAVAQYERAIQQAFREVADALAARATLGTQLQAQRAQAEAEAQRLALVDRLLEAGAATALERLDAERAQLAAVQAVLQLELALRQNRVLLWRVLGGGTAVGAQAAAGADSPR
jgi:outer membrane protein, multidrug efflux system